MSERSDRVAEEQARVARSTLHVVTDRDEAAFLAVLSGCMGMPAQELARVVAAHAWNDSYLDDSARMLAELQAAVDAHTEITANYVEPPAPGQLALHLGEKP